MGNAQGSATPATYPVEQIEAWMRVIAPRGLTELRCPKSGLSGFFRDVGALARSAYDLSEGGQPAVYFGLNPVSDDLYERAPDEVRRVKNATKDADTFRRDRLLIDFDPVRDPDTNSSDTEKAKAREVAEGCRDWLTSQGWPEPAFCDSGNGYHLIYGIELPSIDGELVKRVLIGLAMKFRNDWCDIDKVVFNPSRISKLYGTVSRKGPHTDERPHRASCVISLPETLQPVPVAKLEAVAWTEPKRTPPPAATASRESVGDVEKRAVAYLQKMPGAVQGSNGSGATYAAAVALVHGFCIDVETALQLMLTHYNPMCSPPWEEHHLRHKVEDAATKTHNEPRGWLRDKPRERTATAAHQRNGAGPPAEYGGEDDGGGWDDDKEHHPAQPGPRQPPDTLPEGTKVVTSSGTIGKVVADYGAKVSVCIVDDLTGEERTADFLKASLALPDGSPAGVTKPKKFTLKLIGSADFDATDYRQRFLCKRILVANQPAIMGGPQKSLKTSQAVDLALSLGTGTPFLGQFEVPEQVPVVVLSGESGGFTLKETARRIMASKGLDLRDARVHWGFSLPQLSRRDHLDALGEQLLATGAKVLFVDPAYLCMLSGGDGGKAANLFDMGAVMAGVSEIGELTGCTIVLLHHLRKPQAEKNGRRADFRPPGLEELAFAGFSEWARQWLLIGRRETYEPGSGLHKLWLTSGGSAGHGGLWAIDIDEGAVDDNFAGRKWEVSISTGHEAVQASRGTDQNDKTARAKQERRERILDLLRATPAGATERDIRMAAKTDQMDAKAIISELLLEGLIAPCKITKANHAKYDGFTIQTPTLFENRENWEN